MFGVMKVGKHQTLVELLSKPTSPLNEYYVADYLRRWAQKRSAIQLTADEFGNLCLRLRRGSARASKPLIFCAHMDHPGFEAVRMVGVGRLKALWLGSVSPEYFPGAGVRFFSNNRWVRGKIASIEVVRDGDRKRVKSVTARVSAAVPPGSIGMWDLPNPIIRGTRLHARSCDDVGGVAAILAAVDKLCRKRSGVDMYALFTRAEEIGFAGALGSCRSGLLPKKAQVISVECSSEIPGVRMGEGPILRVGDSTSIFNSDFTAFCEQIAKDLAKRDRAFKFQRKLMDAGTCEATVFQAYGWEVSALCIALGNYHNMNRKRQRIAAEYIDLKDFDNLVRWIAALATTEQAYSKGNPELRRKLDELSHQRLPVLKGNASKNHTS